jgi:hypothetical protein
MTDDNLHETPEANEASPSRTRVKFNLICASKVKKYALGLAKEQMRTKNHTRVSEEFLLSCEVALKQHIQSRVKMQPTKGKTLT